MYLIIISLILLLIVSMSIRGGGFHNHLVSEAARIFQRAGFDVRLECPIRLPDGRKDFIDLLVKRQDCSICIEVETTIRHLVENATKADAVGLPLWVVVPTRKVKKAAIKKLCQSHLRPGGLKVYFLLLDELEQRVMKYFPCFPSANSAGENKEIRKTNQKGAKNEA